MDMLLVQLSFTMKIITVFWMTVSRGYVGVTDADGNFRLPDFSAAAQGGSVVVLPGGVDTNTGHKIGAMQVNVPKDADGNPILSDPDSPDAQAAISSPLTLITCTKLRYC